MEFIDIIVISAVLGFGFTMMVPITIHFSLNIDTQLLATLSVRFLCFKYNFAERKIIYKSTIKHGDNRLEKTWTVGMSGSLVKSLLSSLPMIVRERRTLRRTLTAFAHFAQTILISDDRLYIKINLTGGLSSPDLTGQLYGLFQSCRAIPYDFLSLSYHPNFMEDKLRGTIVAGTVFRIYEFITQLVLFIWRLPVMKLIIVYYNYRKEADNV
ncbi:MAG: hypothetical protein PVF37_16760 [Desulfobacterales bacterium]|jgi:hypothetical protein